MLSYYDYSCECSVLKKFVCPFHLPTLPLNIFIYFQHKIMSSNRCVQVGRQHMEVMVHVWCLWGLQLRLRSLNLSIEGLVYSIWKRLVRDSERDLHHLLLLAAALFPSLRDIFLRQLVPVLLSNCLTMRLTGLSSLS